MSQNQGDLSLSPVPVILTRDEEDSLLRVLTHQWISPETDWALLALLKRIEAKRC